MRIMLDTLPDLVIHNEPIPLEGGGILKKPHTIIMKDNNNKDLYKGGDSVLFSAIIVSIAGLVGLILLTVSLIINYIF